MKIWCVMTFGGLLTFLIRFSLIYAFGRMDVPVGVHRVLRFVPPAVLSAIIFPEVLMTGGRLDVSLGNHRLIAMGAAVVAAFVTKKAIPTIAIGMAALFALRSF